MCVYGDFQGEFLLHYIHHFVISPYVITRFKCIYMCVAHTKYQFYLKIWCKCGFRETIQGVWCMRL